MRKRKGWLLLLLFLTGLASPAFALEIQAAPARPFDENIITVSCGEGGRLTILASIGTLELESPVEDMEILPGNLELVWHALTYGGEPLPKGNVTLKAVLTREDGSAEEAETEVRINTPVTAVVSCLPSAQSLYPDTRNPLVIECSMAASGTCCLEITRKENPGTILYRAQDTNDGKKPSVFRWNGKAGGGKTLEPGIYVITAHSYTHPEWVQSAEVTLLSEPLPEPEIAETGNLIPEDLNDDEAVWKALTAPVVVGRGGEGKGLIIYEKPRNGAKRVGSVNCHTVGLAVLGFEEKDWVRVGVWRQYDNAYTEGYVKKEKIRAVRPNTRYGALVDKAAQVMILYENGKRIGSIPVSTGWMNNGLVVETGSGVYLMGTRLGSFNEGDYSYRYAIRIDGYNLVHQIGYSKKNGIQDFTDQIATLGSKASHGCIRVDVRNHDGFNAWWIWTHMGQGTKIIVTDD